MLSSPAYGNKCYLLTYLVFTVLKAVARRNDTIEIRIFVNEIYLTSHYQCTLRVELNTRSPNLQTNLPLGMPSTATAVLKGSAKTV